MNRKLVHSIATIGLLGMLLNTAHGSKTKMSFKPVSSHQN